MSAVPQGTVKNILGEVLAQVCGGGSYNHSKAKRWTAEIISRVCEKLGEFGVDDVKYIVSCAVAETNGSGYFSASMGYWENKSDGCVKAEHEAQPKTARSSGVTVTGIVYWLDSKNHGVSPPEEQRFDEKQVKQLAEQQLTALFTEASGYDHAKSSEQCQALMNSVMRKLLELKKPYKYIANCTLLQRLPTVVEEYGPYGTWAGEPEAATIEDGASPRPQEISETIPEDVADGDVPTGGTAPFHIHGKAGGGFTTSSGVLWDTATDGSATIWRDISAGKGLRCILTVHGVYEGSYHAHRPTAQEKQL